MVSNLLMTTREKCYFYGFFSPIPLRDRPVQDGESNLLAGVTLRNLVLTELVDITIVPTIRVRVHADKRSTVKTIVLTRNLYVVLGIIQFPRRTWRKGLVQELAAQQLHIFHGILAIGVVGPDVSFLNVDNHASPMGIVLVKGNEDGTSKEENYERGRASPFP